MAKILKKILIIQTDIGLYQSRLLDLSEDINGKYSEKNIPLSLQP